MAIGLVLYFAYSHQHSRLATGQERSARQEGQQARS
jgi:hypothetical protein